MKAEQRWTRGVPLSSPLNTLSFSSSGIFLNSEDGCGVSRCVVRQDEAKRTFCALGQPLATQHVLFLVLDDLDTLSVECLLELVEVDAWSGRRNSGYPGGRNEEIVGREDHRMSWTENNGTMDRYGRTFPRCKRS